MLPILLWILTVFIWSIWDTFYKIALNLANLSGNLFKFFAVVWSIPIIVFILILQWVSFGNVSNLILLWTLGISILWFANGQLRISIVRKEKLSHLLPYNDLDKIFTVVLWFFLYLWTEKSVSLTTLIITLLAIIVVILFSIDFKNISFPKTFGLIIVNKLIRSALLLAIAFLLIHISSGEYFIVKWFWESLIIFVLIFVLKDNFRDVFTQSKAFYKARWVPAVMWGISYLLWLYVIELSGIIIATLLGFLWIIFNILAMKFIAKDTPSQKQILLAFIVTSLIAIGYYFK